MGSSSPFFCVAVLLVLAVLSGAGSAAQAQDVQVAFAEEEGGLPVEVIDAALRDQLGLFSEVEGFEEARLFRNAAADDGRADASDDAYELVLRYRKDGRLLRERRPLSEPEVQDLRERVRRALVTTTRIRLEDGHYRFLTATTTLGAINVPLLAAASGVRDARIAAAPWLGAGAGFFIPLLITREGRVTQAEATLTGYGGVQGLTNGILISALFAEERLGERAALTITSATSVAGAAAGYGLARQTNMRGGTAETMASGGLFGTSLGFYAGALVTGAENDAAARLTLISALAGSGGGAYGGYRLARAAGYTQGDARFFTSAGLVGVQFGITAVDLADIGERDDDGIRSGTALLAGGTLGGLALGHLLVRGRDFSDTQGNLAVLGTYAGGLAGTGVSIAVGADTETALALTALGSLSGLLTTYFAYRGAAQSAARSNAFDLDVSVKPGSALEGGHGGPLGSLTPALNVRLSF